MLFAVLLAVLLVLPNAIFGAGIHKPTHLRPEFKALEMGSRGTKGGTYADSLDGILQDGGLPQDWHWENPFPEGNHLLGVTTSPNGTVYAVGFLGTIDVSTDQGMTWTTLHSTEGVHGVLTSVTMVDNNTGYAVGAGGAVLQTGDGGTTWNQLGSPTALGLMDVNYDGVSTVWVTTSNGLLYSSVDGVPPWTQQPIPTPAQVNGVYFVDANDGWAVTDSGEIWHTTTGGTPWMLQTSNHAVAFTCVQFISLTQGWAVASDRIYRTVDGGATWDSSYTPQATYRSISMLNDGMTGWAVGVYGQIGMTLDGGQSFTPQTSNTPNTLEGVHFVDNMNGYAVGLYGTILRTTNGGAPWVNVSRGNHTEPLVSISMAPTGFSIAASSQGDMLVSADTGHTWEVKSPLPGVIITSVTSQDYDNIWAASGGGSIYYSSDSGSTWTQQTTGLGAALNAVQFVSSNDGFAVGASGRVVYTTDGADWYPDSLGVTNNLFGLYFLSDAMTGWVVGSSGYIAATTNGGVSWQPQGGGFGTQTLRSVYFSSDGVTGWAVGDNGLILGTTTGGFNWAVQGAGITSARLQGVAYSDYSGTGWAIGEYGTILYTPDGTNWSLVRNATMYPLSGIAVLPGGVDDGRAWAVGGSGTILQHGDPAVTKIPRKTHTVANEAYNYPNPFNPSTNIVFALSKTSVMSVRIYDILGRLVSVLRENQTYTAGTHSLLFTPEKSATGIYLCRISSRDGSFNKTIKLLFIK
jgi:photosystem II stability/assembly factor-like uncharacterized protein